MQYMHHTWFNKKTFISFGQKKAGEPDQTDILAQPSD